MDSLIPSKENVRNWHLYEFIGESTAKLAADNINDVNKGAIHIRQAQ